jgi:hypothetical protein
VRRRLGCLNALLLTGCRADEATGADSASTETGAGRLAGSSQQPSGASLRAGARASPDDIDGRTPAVVSWADGDLHVLVVSDTLQADELLRIAASIYYSKRSGRSGAGEFLDVTDHCWPPPGLPDWPQSAGTRWCSSMHAGQVRQWAHSAVWPHHYSCCVNRMAAAFQDHPSLLSGQKVNSSN